jgi:hypothetical protein
MSQVYVDVFANMNIHDSFGMHLTRMGVSRFLHFLHPIDAKFAPYLCKLLMHPDKFATIPEPTSGIWTNGPQISQILSGQN